MHQFNQESPSSKAWRPHRHCKLSHWPGPPPPGRTTRHPPHTRPEHNVRYITVNYYELIIYMTTTIVRDITVNYYELIIYMTTSIVRYITVNTYELIIC